MKLQQWAHHQRQEKAAKAQLKAQEKGIRDSEGDLRRLRGTMERLKTLWCEDPAL